MVHRASVAGNLILNESGSTSVIGPSSATLSQPGAAPGWTHRRRGRGSRRHGNRQHPGRPAAAASPASGISCPAGPLGDLQCPAVEVTRMLAAPTTDNKTEATAGKAPEPPQVERAREVGGGARTSLHGGPPPSLGAGMMAGAVGRQSALRGPSGHAATGRAPITPLRPSQGGLIQRKCACGGTPGPTGECEGCHAERLGIQTKLMVSEPGDAVPSRKRTGSPNGSWACLSRRSSGRAAPGSLPLRAGACSSRSPGRAASP